jgi:hypothetical protein
MRLSDLDSDDVKPLVTEEDLDPKKVRLSMFDEDEIETLSDSGVVGAGIKGGIHGLTAGFSDEIIGGMPFAGNFTGGMKALAGYGSEDADVREYKSLRNKARADYEKARKDHPIAFGAGEIGGIVAGPGKVLKGAGLIKGGIVAGLASGAGDSKAELSDGEYKDLAIDTATGGVVGGVAGGAGKLLHAGASKLAPEVSALIKRIRSRPAVETEVVVGGGPKVTDGMVKTAQGLGKEVFGEAPIRKDAADVVKAIQQITGSTETEIPSYMLTLDEPTQNLASTVLKGPSVAGGLERRAINPIRKGLHDTADEVAGLAGNASEFQTGTKVAQGLKEEFQKRIAPAEAIYDSIEGEFSKIPINRVAFRRGIKAMRDDAKMDWSGNSAALLDKLENTFNSTVDDISSLKKFRTKLGSSMEQAATKEERAIIDKMYDVLTRERNRSILRYESNIPDAKGILGKLREADRIYRNELTRTSEVLGVQGGRKASTRQAIGKFLDETPPEQVYRQLFDRGDVRGLQQMKTTFPEQFELLRQRALGTIIEKSKHNDVLSPQRLMSELNRMPPEVQEMLLGDMWGKTQSARKVLGALPRNFNPSDTTTHAKYWEMFNPRTQAQAMAHRAILKKKVPSAQQIRTALGDSGDPGAVRVIQRLQSKPGSSRFIEPLVKAAQRGENSFGATYYLLHQTEQEFRKAMDDDDAAGDSSGGGELP